MRVVKRHGRLFIVDGERDIYSPPDFIRHRIPGREPIERLAIELEQGCGIDAVARFEAAHHPKRAARRPLPSITAD